MSAQTRSPFSHMAGAPFLVLGVAACVLAAFVGARTRSRGTACQFARVVKGVDLRSTAGNCARVRTPQLTCFGIPEQSCLPASDGASPEIGHSGAWFRSTDLWVMSPTR